MNKAFTPFDYDQLLSFVENQLEVWPLAKQNYDALGKTQRKLINLGGYEMAVQHNPARVISTAAKVKDGIVEKRPCFLCGENRPEEQIALEILPGWKFLVNPYPIFPLHFTIVAGQHQPQARVPEDIVKWAEILPGMTVFYNVESAGASAPDHLHMQAVLKEELPLLNLVEKAHTAAQPGLNFSADLGFVFPFYF
ncbi:MAG: DUF4922 domain-containing protein, partial [Muribaculaceae bacterium]|nr:DUF4922 domain-containing protein [Muribaculaceae bacterium]